MTTADAARMLGVTPAAISLKVKRGELEPVLKLPGLRGAFLFDSASIEALTEGSSNDHNTSA